MRILFKTNLDEAQRDVHALNSSDVVIPNVPQMGSNIRFRVPGGGRYYDLEVVNVTLDHEVTDGWAHEVNGPTYLVELHIPRAYGQSINDWMAAQKRLRRPED